MPRGRWSQAGRLRPLNLEAEAGKLGVGRAEAGKVAAGKAAARQVLQDRAAGEDFV